MSKPLSQNQKTFNKVARHLLRQNEKCASEDGTCFYRHNGLRCAIGALIPNHLYRKCMEGKSPSTYDDMPQDDLDRALVAGGHSLSLCAKLQHIHDDFYTEQWREELEYFATKNGLKMPTDI